MRHRTIGLLGAAWGLTGVAFLLVFAIYRLTLVAMTGLTTSLTWIHWGVLIGFALFMLYSEGYRGFQRAFSPRVAARARYLARSPRPILLILAPFFCFGLFHATRRRMIVSYGLTLTMVALVTLVRHVPQPWRGIIDVGVVLGLVWGVVTLAFFSVQALAGDRYPAPPEVPEGE